MSAGSEFASNASAPLQSARTHLHQNDVPSALNATIGAADAFNSAAKRAADRFGVDVNEVYGLLNMPQVQAGIDALGEATNEALEVWNQHESVLGQGIKWVAGVLLGEEIGDFLGEIVAEGGAYAARQARLSAPLERLSAEMARYEALCVSCGHTLDASGLSRSSWPGSSFWLGACAMVAAIVWFIWPADPTPGNTNASNSAQPPVAAESTSPTPNGASAAPSAADTAWHAGLTGKWGAEAGSLVLDGYLATDGVVYFKLDQPGQSRWVVRGSDPLPLTSTVASPLHQGLPAEPQQPTRGARTTLRVSRLAAPGTDCSTY